MNGAMFFDFMIDDVVCCGVFFLSCSLTPCRCPRRALGQMRKVLSFSTTVAFIIPTFSRTCSTIMVRLLLQSLCFARCSFLLGIIILFLPPYSPDLNPIEESFSTWKAYLRAKGRAIAAAPDPVEALIEATSCITPEKATAWFKHAGYIW